jgi:hypothetical protein
VRFLVRDFCWFFLGFLGVFFFSFFFYEEESKGAGAVKSLLVRGSVLINDRLL